MGSAPFFRLLAHTRFSLASLAAVWMALGVPLGVILIGIFGIGGGFREGLAVLLAASLFASADWVVLTIRIAREADEDPRELGRLLNLEIGEMAEALRIRYLT